MVDSYYTIFPKVNFSVNENFISQFTRIHSVNSQFYSKTFQTRFAQKRRLERENFSFLIFDLFSHVNSSPIGSYHRLHTRYPVAYTKAIHYLLKRITLSSSPLWPSSSSVVVRSPYFENAILQARHLYLCPRNSLERSFRTIGRAIRHFQCVLIYELTIEVTPGAAVCVYTSARR